MTADITDIRADMTTAMRKWFAVMSVIMSVIISVPLPAQSLPSDTTITIRSSSSSLEFDPASIVVKQGTRVKLRFLNAGTLPHNFVLVKDENDIDALALAAMQEGGDYVPKDMKNRLLAYTKLASPGQTVEMTFVAPRAGVYTYVCLMSGHAAMMLGTLHSQR
jgi:plastocyanin